MSAASTGKTILMATKAEQLSLEGEKPVVFFVPCADESVKTLLALDMEKRHNFEVHSLESHLGRINFQELEDLIRDKYKDYHIFIDELILKKEDSTILKKISKEVLIHPNQVFWVTITGVDLGVDATSELTSDFFIPELLNPLRNTSEILNYSFFERGKYILILSFKSNVI